MECDHTRASLFLRTICQSFQRGRALTEALTVSEQKEETIFRFASLHLEDFH